LCCHWGSEY